MVSFSCNKHFAPMIIYKHSSDCVLAATLGKCHLSVFFITSFIEIDTVS